MKAPDKIYLNKYMFRTGMFYKAQDPITPDIEYIRKDALLKWIEGKMTVEEETEGYIGGYDAALKEVIDWLDGKEDRK